MPPTRTLALAALLLLVSSGPLAGPPTSAAAPPPPAAGKVFLTVEEALELAFPECTVERSTIYLTKDQRKAIDELAGTPLESGIVHVYAAQKDAKRVGWAYFDNHKVRTLRETLMVVVDTELRIRRLELLAFGEPLDYVPRGNWYSQFLGCKLDKTLRLKGKIRGITGATLTARATTDAVRRCLAVHETVVAPPAPEPARP